MRVKTTTVPAMVMNMKRRRRQYATQKKGKGEVIIILDPVVAATEEAQGDGEGGHQ